MDTLSCHADERQPNTTPYVEAFKRRMPIVDLYPPPASEEAAATAAPSAEANATAGADTATGPADATAASKLPAAAPATKGRSAETAGSNATRAAAAVPRPADEQELQQPRAAGPFAAEASKAHVPAVAQRSHFAEACGASVAAGWHLKEVGRVWRMTLQSARMSSHC